MELPPEILAMAERQFKSEIDTPHNDLNPHPARLAYELRNLRSLTETLARIVMSNIDNGRLDPKFSDDLKKDVAANSEASVSSEPKYPDLDAELAAMEADHITHLPAFIRAVRAKLGL